MKKRIIIAAGALLVSVLASGCGSSNIHTSADADYTVTVQTPEGEQVFTNKEDEKPAVENETVEENVSSLEDGVYIADFNTDSTMFHVNET